MEDICKKLSNQYEILNQTTKSQHLRIINNNLEKIYNHDLSRYCIRIIKNNKLTLTTIDRGQDPNTLLQISDTLPYGTSVDFDFPNHEIKDPVPHKLNHTSQELHEKLSSPLDYLTKEIPITEISAGMKQINTKTSLKNSSGFNKEYEKANIRHSYSISIENTQDRISRSISSGKLSDFPEEALKELILLYKASKTRKIIPSGNYRVIFSPNALWSLLWRISSAISGTNLLYKLTPLHGKKNEKVFPDLISIYEDPEETLFDDEGVPTSKKDIFKNGIFKDFIFDLYTAFKTNNKPSGNGFKKNFWSSSINTPPSPAISKLFFSPGNHSKKEILDQDRAILIESVIGAHSGNIVQGQYSMGISLGFLIENGQITSMIDGAMISGNIYEDFLRIIAVSKELIDLEESVVPYILFEDLPIVL